MAGQTLERLFLRLELDSKKFGPQLKAIEGDVRRSAPRMTGSFRGAAAAASTLGLALGALGASQVISKITDAALATEKIENGLRAATGSAAAAATEFAFVREEADRLGLDLQSAAQDYTRLAAAARGTALEGQATRDIFTAVAEASTVMGLSADKTSGALVAIEQIISKGNVSAEELRGQLGERLPGAFQIAARAMGVTTQQLDQMLKKGELTAEDLLPRLADELRATFGGEVEQAAKGLQAEINRVSTATFDFFRLLGESGLKDAGIESLRTISSLFEDLNAQIESANKEQNLFIKTLKYLDTIDPGAYLRRAVGVPTNAEIAEYFFGSAPSPAQGAAAARGDIAPGQFGDLGVTRTSVATGDTGISASEQKKLDRMRERNRKIIDDLEFQAEAFKKTERQIFIDTATRRLNAQATEAQREQVRELAGAMFDEKEALDETNERRDRARQIFEETRTPMEIYQEKLMELEGLYHSGEIGLDTYTRAVERAAYEMDDFGRRADRAFDNAASSLIELGISGEMSFDNLRRAGLRFINDIAQAALMQLSGGQSAGGGIASFLISSIGSIFSGGFAPTPTGAANPRAIGLAPGGPAEAGLPYVVGEGGRELFVPESAGRVIPNRQTEKMLSGGGTSVAITFSVDARGAEPGVEHRIDAALDRRRPELIAEAVAAVKGLSDQGGGFSTAVGRRARR